MNIFVTVLLVLTAGLIPVEGCGSKNIECRTSQTFRFCFLVGNYTIYVNSIELSCSDDKICNENDGEYACIDTTENSTSTSIEILSQSTTSTTTSTTTVSSTTAKAVTAPDCSITGTGKFSAQECNQYYECTQFLWWYYLNLYTCDSGTAFDLISQACITSGTCV